VNRELIVVLCLVACAPGCGDSLEPELPSVADAPPAMAPDALQAAPDAPPAALAWSPAMRLDGATRIGAFSPALAVSAAGDAMVVWWQDEALVAQHLRPDGGWDPTVVLATKISNGIPQVVGNAHGDFVVAWRQWTPARGLVIRRFTRAGGWDDALMLAGELGEPQLAINDAGMAAVAWVQEDGLYVTRFIPARGWARSEPVSFSADLGSITDGGIALDAAGGLVAVWGQSLEGGARIALWSSRRTSSGWSNPAEIIGSTFVWQSTVAIDVSGDVIVAWTAIRRPPGKAVKLSVMAARYVEGQGWLAAERLDRDDDDEAGAPVLMTSAGGTALFWTSRRAVAITHLTPAGWDELQTTPAGPQDWHVTRPGHAATSPDGRTVAVWMRKIEGRGEVWTGMFTPGTGWHSLQRISVEDGTDGYDNRVGVDASGRAVAVWRQYFAGGHGVSPGTVVSTYR